MLNTFHRYAVAIALLVLGLSGCSSPQKSAKGTTTSNDTDSLSASTKKLEQDLAQTESDFGKLEAQGGLKK